MSKLSRKPRSSKADMVYIEQMLYSLWERAFLEKEPVKLFLDCPEKAKSLRDSLAGYRRKISSKKMDNLDVWVKINSVSLSLQGNYVVLERKSKISISSLVSEATSKLAKNSKEGYSGNPEDVLSKLTMRQTI